MAGIEDQLPEEYQFNGMLREYHAFLEDELNQFVAQGDVISVQGELESPVDLLIALSEEFALATHVAPEDLDGATRVTYRGFQFGAYIAEQISPSVPRFVSLGYLAEIQEESRVIEAIFDEVQEYLHQRPALMDLITLYVDEIDPSSRFGAHVELAAGFMVMHAEKQVSEEHMFATYDATFSNPN